MVELGDNVSKEGISRLLGWQYAFAPGKYNDLQTCKMKNRKKDVLVFPLSMS